jgi:(R)-citramalate synthase
LRKIEIMDTTLRDGEQMQGVSYTSEEKLLISQILLTEVKVDRLEITSAKASAGEKESVSMITRWADQSGYLDKLEILSFVDTASIDWSKSVGIKRINLLTKASLKHCTEQLRKTPQQHFDDIEKIVSYAVKNHIEVNIYLETFSNGMQDSPEYLFSMIDRLKTMPIKRIMLPDTLGILNPFNTFEYVSEILKKYPGMHFDFHSHNDYGLGVANILGAVKAGIHGVHVTVNGLGERAGNASLDEVVVGLKDFFNVKTNVVEKNLMKISKLIETFSGQRMCSNKPIFGSNVFIQTAGVHADGDKKGNLYFNPLIPERFGRTREYALGKLSGKANLDMNLKKLGIDLDEEKKKILLTKIIDLGDKKKNITTEDIPYLISDIFDTKEELKFKLLNCVINTTYSLKPFAAIKCSYKGEEFDAYDYGDGGYDAFMNALRQILTKFDISIPKLVDYSVNIPPGGKTDALVQTTISWEIKGGQKPIITRGVNPDQIIAAIEATIKLINAIVP